MPDPSSTEAAAVIFRFDVDPRFGRVSRLFGVTRENSMVEVGSDNLVARFGPWRVETPLANVESTEVSGPYAWFKVIGPAHLSMSDRGLTFATTDRRGLCISFREPVRGIEPLGLIRHPGLTVTVEDPRALGDLLDHRRA